MDYQEYVRYEPLLARRASAAALDYILFFAVCFLYIRFVGTENEAGTYEANGAHHLFLLTLLWFVYFPLLEGLLGYTLFKGLFDIQIVCEKRLNSRVGTAFKRHLLDPIDFAFFGLVAIILVKTRDDHKRLGDMVAYSHVVRESDVQPDPVPEELKEVQDAQHQ